MGLIKHLDPEVQAKLLSGTYGASAASGQSSGQATRSVPTTFQAPATGESSGSPPVREQLNLHSASISPEPVVNLGVDSSSLQHATSSAVANEKPILSSASQAASHPTQLNAPQGVPATPNDPSHPAPQPIASASGLETSASVASSLGGEGTTIVLAAQPNVSQGIPATPNDPSTAPRPIASTSGLGNLASVASPIGGEGTTIMLADTSSTSKGKKGLKWADFKAVVSKVLPNLPGKDKGKKPMRTHDESPPPYSASQTR
ncbi:hypothetical protein MD484_g4052, partial [Candolleomyces efflorescens]